MGVGDSSGLASKRVSAQARSLASAKHDLKKRTGLLERVVIPCACSS